MFCRHVRYAFEGRQTAQSDTLCLRQAWILFEKGLAYGILPCGLGQSEPALLRVYAEDVGRSVEGLMTLFEKVPSVLVKKKNVCAGHWLSRGGFPWPSPSRVINVIIIMAGPSRSS